MYYMQAAVVSNDACFWTCTAGMQQLMQQLQVCLWWDSHLVVYEQGAGPPKQCHSLPKDMAEVGYEKQKAICYVCYVYIVWKSYKDD